MRRAPSCSGLWHSSSQPGSPQHIEFGAELGPQLPSRAAGSECSLGLQQEHIPGMWAAPHSPGAGAAELGGLLVTHWEFILLACPSSVSAVSESVGCAGLPPMDSPELPSAELASPLWQSVCWGCLQKREAVCDSSGCFCFGDRALTITAAFPSDLRITKQIHLIYPKFPERQFFSLDLLCEGSKWRSLFCF